jgi:hypothetical protein
MSLQTVDLIAAGLFAVALVHTFAAKQLERLSHRYPRHAGLFHLLGEVEVVFGFWAIVLVLAMAWHRAARRHWPTPSRRNYTEPLFVFVVMVIAGSRPVLESVRWARERRGTDAAAARAAGDHLARAGPGAPDGLARHRARRDDPGRADARAAGLPSRAARAPKYAAIGVLFVNVSIGGTLTSYAAPPVLMVASTWGWDSAHMLANFGWKAALAVVVNASAAVLVLRRHWSASGDPDTDVPAVRGAMARGGDSTSRCWPAVVLLAHHPWPSSACSCCSSRFAQAYERHQNPLLIKEALLVAFFLAGLVVLGGLQRWWLQPLVSALEPLALFFGRARPDRPDRQRRPDLPGLADSPAFRTSRSTLLVAGAVAGGGLTVIANAPNPAGLALLKRGFSDRDVGAGGLFLGALGPTVVAAAAFLLL